jgi:hypothetical protein
MDRRAKAGYAARWTIEDTSGENAVTEAEWLNCIDAVDSWGPLRGHVSERKHRLFVCACCRLWHHNLSAAILKALEVAERFADELVGWEELAAAEEEAITALDRTGNRAGHFAIWSLHPHPGKGSGEVVGCIRKHEGREHTAILLELLGNPFRPVTIVPSIFAWNDGTIPKLAQGIYEERAFDRLPILADALEEAGCQDQDILGHCRSGGEHVRGCWVLDLLLGKS